MRTLILGTAGHIDHGKTRLVQALTGVDTDRLAEEKRRGITIDLGFAPLRLGDELELGVVDVPGHEGLVRTMLAGATGMDLLLLVVAADEGVMPQTREHLSIAELLGVSRAVVAITKRDLVDAEFLELAEDDVRATLASTPLSAAPLVGVSAHTGEGMEELRAALRTAAVEAPLRRQEDLFRLPIDRVFTVHGTGTVVTGTAWHGTLEAETSVHALPAGLDCRVRGLQVHGRPAPQVGAGQRAAVALAGVPRHELARGSVLVTGPGWRAHGMLTVRLRHLPSSPRPLAHRQRVRVHLGTAEVLGRVVLLEGRELEPGGEAWAQLRLERPVVARAGDRVVLRTYSPVTTIGGGIVAEPVARKRRRRSIGVADSLGELLAGDPVRALRARAVLAGWEGAPLEALAVEVGIPPGDVEAAVAAHVRAGGLRTRERVFAEQVRRAARERLLAAVERGHREEPLRPGVDREAVRRALPPWSDPRLADAVLEELAAEGALVVEGGTVREPGFVPRADRDQEVALARLRELFTGAGLEWRSTGELPAELAGRADLRTLLRLLEEAGDLVCVAPPDGYAARAAVEGGIARVRAALGGCGEVPPTAFKDVLALSRKHLIPLLEHFDRLGVTRRGGTGRTVLP